MSSPRAETDLSSKHDAVAFAGLFEVPDVDLEIQVFDREHESWTRIGVTRTRAKDPVLDASGHPYFRYADNVVLPQAARYWTPLIGRGQVEAHVRVCYGERVLQTFGSDAESCARKLQQTGAGEALVLTSCAAKTAYARLFASACGGAGEPCCASSAARGCNDAFQCQAGVCQSPSYPSAIVSDYQVDLSVPADYTLRDAWLVMDDTSDQTDSERALLVEYRALAGVRSDTPHAGVARLGFDFAFWKPGVNRFWVRGVAVKGGAIRAVKSAIMQLEYQLPRALGMRESGLLELPESQFTRDFARCQGLPCKDADGDGLNDLWENVALHQLRPRLELDSGDDLFARSDDVVRVLSSVMPIERAGERYVLFAHVLAFSRDYGHLIGWSHAGDTEAFAMLFHVEADGALRWQSSMSKGHACLTCGPQFRWSGRGSLQDFADDGTPLVFVERDKHGLWHNGRQCRTRSAFGCRGDRSLRPEAVNVGDFAEHGPRILVDALDGLAPSGPFGELAGLFPGEAVWTPSRARIPGRFCGGRSDCSRSSSANQPGAVLASMVRLFERTAW